MKASPLFICLLFVLNKMAAQSPCISIEFAQEMKFEDLLPNLGEDIIKKFDNLVEVYSYNYCNNNSSYSHLTTQKKDPSIPGNASSNDNNRITWYKDFTHKFKYKKSNVKPELVSKEALNFDQDWDIDLKQTKTILGYICHKATKKGTESDITAWFSEDIPIMDGPVEHGGLPGMILMLEMKGFSIKAAKIEVLEQVKEIQMPVADNYVSPKEFDKMNKNKL